MPKYIVCKDLKLNKWDLIETSIDINDYIKPIWFRDFLGVIVTKLESTLGYMSASEADRVVKQCAKEIKSYFNFK